MRSTEGCSNANAKLLPDSGLNLIIFYVTITLTKMPFSWYEKNGVHYNSEYHLGIFGYYYQWNQLRPYTNGVTIIIINRFAFKS